VRPIARISGRPMTSPESASSYERALLGNPEIARRQGRSSSRSRLRNAICEAETLLLSPRSRSVRFDARVLPAALRPAAGK